METVGKILLVIAAALAALGALLVLASKIGLGRMPADILIHSDGVVFIPLGSMLILSLLASLVVYLVRRLL